MGEGPMNQRVESSIHEHDARHVLGDVRRHLQRRALKLVGWLLVVYAVLKLIPALEQALRTLEHAAWEWVLALLALEVLSETGFVFAWSAIVDPENVLGRDRVGRRIDEHVAWTQLGGGLLLPGGSWGGMGLGSVILHRFGMPTNLVAERQFNLSFLNTGIDALALVVFGAGLATGVLAGEGNVLLTLLPAALAGAGIIAALLVAARAGAWANRVEAKHPKIASAITTLATAVQNTKRLLFRRGTWKTVFGVMAYLGFDVAILWCAFLAVHANPVPGFPIVIMAYIIGALGGSIPLPGAAGTIGGMAGMLILYGVAHDAALAAVLLHQAIGLLVPLIGGAIAYLILRRRFGPILPTAAKRSRDAAGGDERARVG
jgi:uncharacterized membrane protein YbhN (UPF0104 family)